MCAAALLLGLAQCARVCVCVFCICMGLAQAGLFTHVHLLLVLPHGHAAASALLQRHWAALPAFGTAWLPACALIDRCSGFGQHSKILRYSVWMCARQARQPVQLRLDEIGWLQCSAVACFGTHVQLVDSCCYHHLIPACPVAVVLSTWCPGYFVQHNADWQA